MDESGLKNISEVAIETVNKPDEVTVRIIEKVRRSIEKKTPKNRIDEALKLLDETQGVVKVEDSKILEYTKGVDTISQGLKGWDSIIVGRPGVEVNSVDGFVAIEDFGGKSFYECTLYNLGALVKRCKEEKEGISQPISEDSAAFLLGYEPTFVSAYNEIRRELKLPQGESGEIADLPEEHQERKVQIGQALRKVRGALLPGDEKILEKRKSVHAPQKDQQLDVIKHDLNVFEKKLQGIHLRRFGQKFIFNSYKLFALRAREKLGLPPKDQKINIKNVEDKTKEKLLTRLNDVSEFFPQVIRSNRKIDVEMVDSLGGLGSGVEGSVRQGDGKIVIRADREKAMLYEAPKILAHELGHEVILMLATNNPSVMKDIGEKVLSLLKKHPEVLYDNAYALDFITQKPSFKDVFEIFEDKDAFFELLGSWKTIVTESGKKNFGIPSSIDEMLADLIAVTAYRKAFKMSPSEHRITSVGRPHLEHLEEIEEIVDMAIEGVRVLQKH